MADCTVPPTVLVDRIMPPVPRPDNEKDEDMALSCCSDDDTSFCSVDASFADDDSLCFDTDDDVSTSMSCANDGDEGTLNVKSEHSLPRLIEVLSANRTEFATLDLSFPVEKEGDAASLLHAIRANRTVTACSIGSDFFQSLVERQRRELADTICCLPGLKCLSMDSCFPEFLHYFNCCRCWKRDHYYQQHHHYWEFQNQTLSEIRIHNVSADMAEIPLGRLVMMTLSNFASLRRLEVTFAGEYRHEMVGIMRVALTALSHSRTLSNIKFGFFDDDQDGDYNFIKEIDATRKDGILRVLKLRCCRSIMSERSYKELAQMLEVHKQALKGLVLDTAVDNSGAFTIANTLGRNSNLKALCLGTFDCRDETRRDGLLSLISQVLLAGPQNATTTTVDSCQTRSSSSPLEYLSLVCQDLDDQGVHQIVKVLSQSRLRELMLFLDNDADTSISSQGISAFANLLQASDTIEELSLICNTLDDEGLGSIVSVLQHGNRTLKTLRLQCSKNLRVTSKGYEAVVQMLKANTVLETFELSRCQEPTQGDVAIVGDVQMTNELMLPGTHRDDYQSKIDFYLRLNRAGVRNLQLNTDTSPNQFLNKIVTQREDLDALFYMLWANPSFVACGTQMQQGVTPTVI